MPRRSNDIFSGNSAILLIVAVFFLSNLTLALLQENVWWDAAVYAGMGKHVFSDGHSGLWESSRPLVWPIILGIFWKLNLDMILFGKIMSLLFAVGTIIMTYLIAKEVFERKTAVLAAFLLAFTPTFFFFSKLMLTEIASTFFSLLGVYFFIRKNYFFSGVFFGLGFMTRFLQLIPFAIICIIFLVYNIKQKNLVKNIIIIGVGFMIPVAPYLALNYLLYGNMMQPFLDQLYLTNNSGWAHFKPWWFYPVFIVRENFIALFSLFGIYFLAKNRPRAGKTTIISIALATLILLSFIHHKEMRFVIMLMPFLFMLASHGLLESMRNMKKIRIPMQYFIVIFMVQAAIAIPYMEKAELGKGNPYEDFHSYLEGKDAGTLWISNPAYTLYYEGKVHNLMYYPVFDREKANSEISSLREADTILVSTCDLECSPFDLECPMKKEELLSNIKENFRIEYSKEGNCRQHIFVR